MNSYPFWGKELSVIDINNLESNEIFVHPLFLEFLEARDELEYRITDFSGFSR